MYAVILSLVSERDMKGYIAKFLVRSGIILSSCYLHCVLAGLSDESGVEIVGS